VASGRAATLPAGERDVSSGRRTGQVFLQDRHDAVIPQWITGIGVPQ
jgi:hypothetical protein